MKKHLTADGESKFIAEMTDSHLKNTVTLLLNNAQACKALINSGSGSESVLEIIHGVSRKQQIGVAKQKIQSIYVNIAPYIMECMIRGFDYSKELSDAFDRNQKSETKILPLSLEIDKLIDG